MNAQAVRGLRRIEPIGGDRYATEPIERAFNWTDCASDLRAGEWYLVAFRSIHRASADEARLDEYDLRASREAARSPGFVHYFRGPLTSKRECLSFCLWETREHARAAARQPAHLDAIGLLHEMYEEYVLEFHRLTLGSGGLRFERYDAPVQSVEIEAPVTAALAE